MRNLEVFQRADQLLFEVLAAIEILDDRRHRSLCDQLRRAALSVPLNLVEGAQRSSTREFGRYVEVSTGSAAETRYLLSVACRLHPNEAPFKRLEQDFDALVRRLQTLRFRMTEPPRSAGLRRET